MKSRRFSTHLLKMKLIFTVFILVNFALVSVDALLADGSKIEANHGEDVTLSFPMDKAEEAGRLRITFTSETTKKTCLIAQRCGGSERCDFVETPGVKLLAGHRHVNVIIQKVHSSRSGLYKVRVFFGKYMFEVDATLVVNEASFSSTTAPPPSCTPKPPDSSHLLWLCALIPLIIVISGVVCFCKRKRKCESGADVESSVPLKPFTSLKVLDPVCAKMCAKTCTVEGAAQTNLPAAEERSTLLFQQ